MKYEIHVSREFSVDKNQQKEIYPKKSSTDAMS